MTGFALPLLQCCRGRSVSFQTREHLMWSITLSWRASAQSLDTPCCRATSVSHGKRGRVHLTLVPDLSIATHPLTLQQQQAPSRARPRVTLCQQQCWCRGNPRVRSGANTLTEFSSSSTMPMRCDQSCLLLLGMVLGIPWGRDRAALTVYLSKQFLLNTLLIASNSKGLSGRNHSDIFLSGSIRDGTGNSENFTMAADVACHLECTQWLVGLGCGRQGRGSLTEVAVLGLTGCS